MVSYVVSGSSRGLGFEFLATLAKDPSNIVIGLARNASSLKAKLQEVGLMKVHAIEGDVSDAASMKRAAAEVSKITNGTLDVLINNAGLVSSVSEFKTLAEYTIDNQAESDADFLSSISVNVLGLTHTISAFIHLLKSGTVKKVMNLSTGMADLPLIQQSHVAFATPYSASKAAANVVVAKYDAVYGKGHDNILFLSVSPGVVSTERNAEAASADAAAVGVMAGQFAAYAPSFKRLLTTEESIGGMLKVLGEKSVEKGDGGAFVSHLGTQQWL